MELNLKGKNVLITGGSKNLGKAIVKAYLDEGANVVFTWYHDKAKAKKTFEELAPFAQGFFADMRADALNEDDVNATFNFCYEKMGSVDVLINNACPSGKEKVLIQDMTDEFWDKEMFGAITPMYLHTRRLCVDCIEKKRKCHIVNVSAREGIKIFSVPGMSAFAAGKAGVIMYTRTLAYQMAPYGIIINGLIPGLVLDEESKADSAYAHIANNKRPGPLKEPATAAEVAKLAVYLGSDVARYIVGSNVDITGGCLL